MKSLHLSVWFALFTTILLSPTVNAAPPSVNGAKMLSDCLGTLDLPINAHLSMKTDIVTDNPISQYTPKHQLEEVEFDRFQGGFMSTFKDSSFDEKSGRIIADAQKNYGLLDDGKIISFATKGEKLTHLAGPVVVQALDHKNSGIYLSRILGPLYGRFGGSNGRTMTELLAGTTVDSSTPDEKVGDILCNVLKFSVPEGNFTMWLTADQKPRLAQILVTKGATSLFDGVPLADQGTVKNRADHLVSWEARLTDIQYSSIGTTSIPKSGKLVIRSKSRSGQEHIKTIKYSSTIVANLNRPPVTAASLAIPDGTSVVDFDHQESGVAYEWQKGKIVPSIQKGDEEKLRNSVEKLNHN